jgi:hypothetical protein
LQKHWQLRAHEGLVGRLRAPLAPDLLEHDGAVARHRALHLRQREVGEWLELLLAPEEACHNRIGSHNRKVESQARRKFMVRIPDMMRVPGQTFEGITADGKRVWGRVPADGAPDGKAIAFLTWGSWADGVVEHTGSIWQKFRTRTREGYCPVGRELKLELISNQASRSLAAVVRCLGNG